MLIAINVNLFLLDPPDFRSPEEEILDISEDSEMVLDCTAEGNPPPLYIWTSSNLQEKADKPVLTAASLGPGVYTCTASNILGKKSKQFVIKHKSKGESNQTTLETYCRCWRFFPLRQHDALSYLSFIQLKLSEP